MTEEEKSPAIMVPITWEESLDFKRLMEWAQAKLPFTSKPLRHLQDKLTASVQRGCSKHGELCASFDRVHRGHVSGAASIVVCAKCSRKVYKQLKEKGLYDDYPGNEYKLYKDQGEV